MVSHHSCDVLIYVERQISYVLRTVEERKVKLIRFWFTDVQGQLKSMAISPVELEVALSEGVHFDGSAIDGFSRVQESDVLARPDPATFQILPWADGGTTARMFCNIYNPSGTPFEGDPRNILKRNLVKAQEKGHSFYVAPEMEFFYFKDGNSPRPEPIDSGGYFDLTTADVASDLRRKTISVLESMGIPVEYSFHEDAPSQHEIDLRYTDAMSMADKIMTFRLVVRELALEQGLFASFLPKPIEDVQGSGMHLHLSLFDNDDKNLFHDPEAQYGLSETGQQFMAGLLHHAPELTAITNPLVNSYKRLVPGFEAPGWITWAQNNRSSLIRVPITKRDKESSTRIEYRSPDPTCNPYLAFAVLMAAGSKGIEEGYDLPKEVAQNTSKLSNGEIDTLGIKPLPRSLNEALEAMEKSELVHNAVGEHVFEWFLRNKRSEWQAYKSHVTQWELDTYLPNW